jgi:hypothetical protein
MRMLAGKGKRWWRNPIQNDSIPPPFYNLVAWQFGTVRPVPCLPLSKISFIKTIPTSDHSLSVL